MFTKAVVFLLITLAAFFFQVAVAGYTHENAGDELEYPPIKHAKIISKLVKCESGGRNIAIVDTNGYYSRGILQYQKATWDWFSLQSGIVGDPMNQIDAIRMTDWAIENGLGHHWSCWRVNYAPKQS